MWLIENDNVNLVNFMKSCLIQCANVCPLRSRYFDFKNTVWSAKLNENQQIQDRIEE